MWSVIDTPSAAFLEPEKKREFSTRWAAKAQDPILTVAADIYDNFVQSCAYSAKRLEVTQIAEVRFVSYVFQRRIDRALNLRRQAIPPGVHTTPAIARIIAPQNDHVTTNLL
jgi:hypothetical protein